MIHNCFTVAYPADLTTWNKTQKVGDREREGKMLLLKERSYGEEESEIETTTF